MTLSRRQVLALTTPALAMGQAPRSRGLRVVCVGGHPDDPESGCGGTLARYAALGHAVTVIYLTRGEAGIPGKSHDEAATIRSAECVAACKILGAQPVFAGEIDGATVVDAKAADSFGRLLSAERPDVVFTQWPIDTHLDHQAASTLTFRAWLDGGRAFELYYYEVNLGTNSWRPFAGVKRAPQRPRRSCTSPDSTALHGSQVWGCDVQLLRDGQSTNDGSRVRRSPLRVSFRGCSGPPRRHHRRTRA